MNKLIKATGNAEIATAYITKQIAPSILMKRNLVIDFIKKEIATKIEAKYPKPSMNLILSTKSQPIKSFYVLLL